MSKVLKNFIGIDISKSYFDAALIKLMHPGQSIHHQFSQCKNGFKKMPPFLGGIFFIVFPVLYPSPVVVSDQGHS